MLTLSHPPKHTKALVLGITGSWAFAAGTLLLSFHRHAQSICDILLLHDGTLATQDLVLLKELGCTPIELSADAPERFSLTTAQNDLYSPLCVAKLACFDLVTSYETVVWLDADVVIQDSLEDIWSFGPLSLAKEDVSFYEHTAPGALINGFCPLPDIDPNLPNYNSGVIVVQNSLTDAASLRADCLNYIRKHREHLRYPDQAALNRLAQHYMQAHNELWHELPVRFNCHPKNPDSVYAPIVHAFGAYKIWNDGLMRAAYPEWQRDYARWCAQGGSPYTGPIDNAAYLGKSTFAVLGSFYETMQKGLASIDALTKQLRHETFLRQKFETLLSKKLGQDL